MQEDQSLFSLSFDPLIKSHLIDTAKWARFISISGMVLLAMFVILAIAGVGFSGFNSADSYPGTEIQSSLKVVMIFTSLTVAVISFFPLYFLLRFSNQARTAVNANDQEAMTEAFLNMKRYFRFLGILFIIGLCFYGLAFIIAIIGSAAFGS